MKGELWLTCTVMSFLLNAAGRHELTFLVLSPVMGARAPWVFTVLGQESLYICDKFRGNNLVGEYEKWRTPT